MRIKKKILEKKAFITILLSYISLFILLSTLYVIVYLNVGKIVEGQTYTANEILLNQVKDNLDNRVREMRQFARQISVFPEMNILLKQKSFRSVETMQLLMSLSENLKKVGAYNDFIDDYYVYFINVDSIIAPSRYLSSALFFNNLHKGGQYNYNEWKNILTKYHFNTCINLPRNILDKVRNETVAFIFSIPAEDPKRPLANVVILVDNAKFIGSLEHISKISGSKLLITNEKGEIVISTGEKIENFDTKILENDNGVYSFNYDGTDVIASHISSDNTGWKYILLMPQELYWDKVEQLRNIMFISILVYFIIGIVMVIFFTNKNYRPIQEIIAYINNKARIDTSFVSDEYGKLKNSIDNIIDEKNKAMSLIRKNQDTIYNSIITGLLTEKISINDKSTIEFQQFDIILDSGGFAVLMFSVDDYGVMFAVDGENNQESYELAAYAIKNILEECVSKKFKGYAAEIDETIACLVSFSEIGANTNQELRKISEEVLMLVQKYIGIKLTASISNIYEKPVKIPEALREAKYAMGYKMLMGTGVVIEYKDVINRSGSYNYNVRDEQILLNCIKAADESKALKYLDEIFEKNINNETSLEIVRCFLYDIIGTVLKMIKEAGKQMPQEKQFEIARDLMNCDTTDKIYLKLKSIIKMLCDTVKIEETPKQDSNKISDTVKEYIQNNYMDVDLNVNFLGYHFEMTPSYLSKLFLEQVGKSINEYILETRIEKAKKLLQETNFSINKIGVMVGYSSSNVFIRAFKKVEGITPGQYKQILEKDYTNK